MKRRIIQSASAIAFVLIVLIQWSLIHQDPLEPEDIHHKEHFAGHLENEPLPNIKIYEQTNCEGGHIVANLDSDEDRCDSCIDMCDKYYPSGTHVNDHVYSIYIPRFTMITLNNKCVGKYWYDDDLVMGELSAGEEGFCAPVTDPHISHMTIKSKIPLEDRPTKPVVTPIENLNHEEVLERLMYWDTDKCTTPEIPFPTPPEPQKYLIFEKGHGGFNNIRMEIEFCVTMAALLGRILVIPPPCPWYLIDTGARTRGGKDKTGFSHIENFWDIDDIGKALTVISMEEFLEKERDRLEIPEHVKVDPKQHDHGKHIWAWLHTRDVAMNWNPLEKIIYWPDIKSIKDQVDLQSKRTFIGRRVPVEYTPEDREKPYLYFPDRIRTEEQKYRFMGQNAAIALFSDPRMDTAYRRFLKHCFHYKTEIFDTASRIGAFLGMFNYSCLHIRRNDLQYKQVFIAANKTLSHISPLLLEGENLYIATDETDEGFFDAIEKTHPVYRWHDFFTERGGYVLNSLQISEKHHGHIEQAVCAMGRVFAGTELSTFSSYIVRLRGHINAPNKMSYYHTKQYSGVQAVDNMFSNQEIQGTSYFREYKEMWEID